MNDKIIDKIKKLLELADSEKNDSENERETALRQANALMDKHNISAMELQEQENPRGEDTLVTGSTIWKTMCIAAIGNLYGCESYRTTGRNGKTFIVGTSHNRQIVISMSQYVINSITREASRNRAYGRAYTNSFKKGGAIGVSRQVESINKERKEGLTVASKKQALVLVDYYKNELVANKQWLMEKGVRVRSAGCIRLSDGDGYSAGQDYGSKMSLNNQLGRKSKRLLG
ncbi:MAG: DUF2786 domain-containing protein [Proteobacteria bacterium]|nr:DUF2786 domain-containing protein [Pseudomonadota bacterium]